MARFLLLILALLSGSAFGADAVLSYWSNAAWMGSGIPFSSAAAACAGTYAAASSSDKTLYSNGVTQVTETACYWSRSNGVQYAMAGLNKGYYCGSVPSAAGACPLTDDEKCGQKGSMGSSSTKWSYSGGYPGYGGGYCIGGCSYDLYGNESYDKASNMSSATGVMKPVPGGKACSSSTTPKTDDSTVNGTNPTTTPSSTDPTPSSCQTGQVAYKGTVNGQSVTVCGQATKSSSTGTTSTDSQSSTTSNNNGTQSTSSTSGNSNKTTKTTCENGQCTTTTTSSGSTGGGSGTSGGSSTSGTETKTQPIADYCKDNPTAQVCKDKSNSSFGGTCGAFSCDGDAVQCAIAREQHQRNCQMFDTPTDMSIKGEGAAGAGDRPSDHPGHNPTDVDVGARMSGVARDNPFGDACPRDFDLVVMGNLVSVPLSEACDILKLMGEIAVAFAFIAGARIVMSGVSSGAT